MDGPKFSKRKSLAKNKKKSWRGIDISETENFLEDQRIQQRTRGPDDQVLVVDRQQSVITAKPARKRKANEDLKCYSNLVNESKVQCPRKEYPTSDFYSARTMKAFTQKKDSRRKTTVSTGTEKQQKDGKATFDLWGEEKAEPEGDDYFNQVTKRKRVKAPDSIKRKCSERPAVEIPHPGTSVNPSYSDHQDLLQQAYMVELQKEKAERKIFNAVDAAFPSAAEAPTEASWLAEMSACLYDKTRAKKVKEDDSLISLNPPVNREQKKTPRERRKEMAAKLKEHEMAQKKMKKQTENKVFSVNKIRSELAEKQKEVTRRAEVKAKKQEAKKFLPKKLGKTKVEMPDLDLKLSEELVGSLRLVKSEGDRLSDIYQSYQLRNMVEPRTKVNKKKTKRKVFEKKSFREVTV